MRYLKDPLALFLVVGAALFAIDAWRSAEGDNVIRVGPLDIARLQDQWALQMGRPPSDEELDALVNAHVREEMLVREALAMGLDGNDVIIRRRLAQKLTFLTEDLALLEPADEAELEAFFQANAERYRVAERLTFSHAYFSPDRRDAARADATAALAAIDDANWRAQGDPFMLRRTYAQVTLADVRKDFGAAFAQALDGLAGGKAGDGEKAGWQGPIESGYGFHLVRLNSRAPSRLPAFAEVATRVRGDFDAERRNQANERYQEALRARYRIEIER